MPKIKLNDLKILQHLSMIFRLIIQASSLTSLVASKGEVFASIFRKYFSKILSLVVDYLHIGDNLIDCLDFIDTFSNLGDLNTKVL